MNANCLSLILPTTLEIVVKSFAWLKDCGPATSWDLRDGDWIHCTPDHSWCLQAFIFLHDFLAATSKTDTVCLSWGYRHMPPYLACDRLFNPAKADLKILRSSADQEAKGGRHNCVPVCWCGFCLHLFSNQPFYLEDEHHFLWDSGPEDHWQ